MASSQPYLERETSHLWWLTTSFTTALQSRDFARADEIIEALVLLAQTTNSKTIRDSAYRAITLSSTPRGTGGLMHAIVETFASAMVALDKGPAVG